MEYCALQGIPRSEFLSWSESDQDAAVAYMLHKRKKCPHCGSDPTEWLYDNGEYREPPPYRAASFLCGGCEAIEDKIKEIPDGERAKYHVFLEPTGSNYGQSIRQDSPPS